MSSNNNGFFPTLLPEPLHQASSHKLVCLGLQYFIL
jgi:hypothetical protein